MSATAQAEMLPKVPPMRIVPQSNWLRIDFGELWHFRELLYFFVWRDVKVRYKQTVVGAAWAVLQPFLTMLVFTLFFARLAHIPVGGMPATIFYYSALLPWMYFSSSLLNATNTIVENQRVITKVYFPRLVLPLAATLSGLVDFGISFLMFVAMMIYYGIRPTYAILFFPLFLLLALLTALGFGLWLAAMNAIYRDVRYVVPFLMQFWMFASPVVYPSSIVPERWRWLYGLNPMAGVIEGFRWSLSGRGEPPGKMIIASSLMVLAVLAGGVAYFQRMETTIADVV
jgi:lipopolysaccharide transport system permease protein